MRVLADLRDSLVELGLAATGDEYIGALFNEPLGGREADAAAASRDEGDLLLQQRHFVSFFVGCRAGGLMVPRTPRSRMLGGKIDARNIDDGLPGGFLVGAIVKVWMELRLDWA
jgi:hypothetical protein